MPCSPWPGEVLYLQDRMFGLAPGLYMVTDFTFSMVELRGTWRNGSRRKGVCWPVGRLGL
jgi:hypothetical protein